jgi:hypothetical protein
MYGAEFYHWPLVDRQVISQMPSLVIAQVSSDYATLQVVTDSCGDLRFVLRELAYCIEDDRGSFNRLMSQVLYPYCEQSLSNVWVVLLSPEYVGVKSDRKSDSVEQRTW